MEKTYNSHKIEKKYRDIWEQGNFFSSKLNSESKDYYSIVLPPPNITGSLHMGHAFQHTIMDILTRYHRAKGHHTLWQPGTDHAGIATQIVVERQLAEQNINKEDLGREKFIEKIWDWKKQSGNKITSQMRKMGLSVDWDRESFTMDKKLSDAVQKVFITLFKEKIIYRGKKLINWDPVLLTAVSDLEVINKEEQGFLWHIKYNIVDSKQTLIIATTRPETMLGDSAVAVNPKDNRYQHLIGKMVNLPLTNRQIPIIADNYVDSEFGSGCVKITPAHDFNDYEIGLRHNLEIINIFTKQAKINENCPKNYQGLDRFVARKKIIQDLENKNLIEKIQDHTLMTPRGDRSNAVIEPYMTDQWFIKIAPLAKPAIDAVKNGEIKFIPNNWEKTYFNWMDNIQDWCISRQIWWGHRIPAWYDESGKVYVAETLEKAQKEAGEGVKLKQETDVLDTWFSSALWPFSTMGWPEDTAELTKFYPTSVLVTGFDIIFFWVSRMIMFSLKFTKKIPFKDIYITGLIKDSNGQKMSKSKGNIIDPIDLIKGISLKDLLEKRTQSMMQPAMAEKIKKQTLKEFENGIPSFGADALRFTFAALSSFGRDIKFDLNRTQGYRNFCNKLWNASRYVLMNVTDKKIQTNNLTANLTAADKWILSKLQRVKIEIESHIKNYRIDLMSQSLYEFVWQEYCGWYLEISKSLLKNNDTKNATQAILIKTLNEILILLHPIIPFITEEIFTHFKKIFDKNSKNSSMLINSSYPEIDNNLISVESEKEISWLKGFILGVRQIRGETNIPPNKSLDCYIQNNNKLDDEYLHKNSFIIKNLGKINNIEKIQNIERKDYAIALLGKMQILIPLKNIFNTEQEASRLNKEILKLTKQQQQFLQKLNNKKFISGAPTDIVQKEKEKLNSVEQKINDLKKQLEKILSL